MNRHFLWLTSVVGCALFTLSACGEPTWIVSAPGSVWEIKGDTIKGRDLSAAAKLSQKWCALGSDETAGPQLAEIDTEKNRLRVQPLIALLPAGVGTEIDIEGMAWSATEKALYLTGSHAMARRRSVNEDTRHLVFRLPIDPATGQANAAAATQASMAPLIKADPVLGPYFNQPLQQKGFNFEGLAEKDGTLFFGVRAPNLDGKAFVISVKASDFFGPEGKSAVTKRHELPLGAGWGIRDLVSINGGFVLIAGNSGAEPNEEFPQAVDWEKGRGSDFWFWAGDGATPVKIGLVPVSPEMAKAEGLLVLEDTPQQVKVLVFYDGEKEGGPTPVTLSRPAAQ